MKNSLSKRLLSLLLCLAMFLSLGASAFAESRSKGSLQEESGGGTTLPAEPEALPVESGDEGNGNPPPSGSFNPYFKIADDMVGGSVIDSQNIYEDTSVRGKQLTPGLLVTLTPHPDAGYELRGWSVVCSQNEEYYLDVDDHGDWAEFVVGGPYNNRYTFVIRAEFEYTGGGYPIDCYSVDATGLGSSISVDRETAKVGDTVTITVDRKPGTALDEYVTYTGALKPYPYACFYCNEDYSIPGGYYIPLTKESDSVYTFVVPEDIERYIKEDDQKIYVRAEFKEAEFFVTVDEVSDPENTGNTVTVDKESAGLGDTVTVSVMSRYATDYGPEGLQVFWLDENEQKHPLELSLTGSSVSPYSSSGETTNTYTFTMPEHDIHITADFVKIGHRISTAPVDVPGQMLRGRFFQGETNLSIPPNEQRAVAGDTITAELHVEHEENMGSYGIRSAWITWEENGTSKRQELGNVRYDEYLHFYGDFVMPDADAVVHAELERSWWVVTEKYSDFSLDPDKWEAFAGETVTVTANLFDEGSQSFQGWTWHVVFYDENSRPVDVDFTIDPATPNRISFQMPDSPVSVSLMSPYSYIERWWNGSAVKENTENPTEYRLISSLQDNENVTLTGGVWVVSENRTFSHRLIISGDVHLVLVDGKTLTCSKGIELAPGNSLSIYGQEKNSGVLKATGSSKAAGIGGSVNTGYGDLTIHGGTVKPTGGDYGAGIGSGDEASGSSFGCFTLLGGKVDARGGTDAAGVGGGNETGSGPVEIYGGTLEARGGPYGAGIGTGDEAGDGRCGSFTIHGGTVKAYGGNEGAGVGGGNEASGGTVTVYGGNLTAEGRSSGAGIGGGDEKAGGSVTIYDGDVTAKGGTSGSGIGGGEGGDQGGAVTIHGGTVTAKGNGDAAGIGGGGNDGATAMSSGGAGGTVLITGGTVTARGHRAGAGIGGGDGKPNGDITITGGSVYAYCQTNPRRGAGIGAGGWESQGGAITITGGSVRAKSARGAGIGGGYHGDAGIIRIEGGLVTATSDDGAGIGGGVGGDGGTITITDGVVIAASTKTGAGIGGGDDGDGGTVEIYGGHVTATGGYFNYDYWEENFKPDYMGIVKSFEGPGPETIVATFILDLIFSGEYGGAGIGGGDGNKGGTVRIYGGTVIATAGTTNSVSIGYGDDDDDPGELSVCDGAMVIYGSNSGGTVTQEGIAPAGERENYPRQKTFSMIQPCTHPDAVYTSVGEAGHTMSCAYCGSASTDVHPHKFEEDGAVCTLCGYERKVHVTLLPGEGSGEAITTELTYGTEYVLPACSFTAPQDMEFVGWKGSVNGGAEKIYPAGSSFRLTRDLTLTARWSDPYRLWVNGVKVSSNNTSDVLGDGKVSYDPETFTLTLQEPVFDSSHEGALIYADDLDLTIVGSGTLASQSYFQTGVQVVSGSLTVAGDINVEDAGNYGFRADEDLSLRSGTIAVHAGSIGILAGKNIYVRKDITRVTVDGSRALSYQTIDLDPGVCAIEHTSANRLPPDDEWDLENANHVVFAQGVVVSFVLNGGELDGETGTVQRNIAVGMSVDEPDPAPTRQGYTFAGWYSDEGLTLEYDFETELDDDISLYAKWTRAYAVEIQWEREDELEAEPDSVRVVLQRGRDGEWTTVQELTITAEDEWKGSFDYVPGPDARDDDQFRVREVDEQTGLPVYDPSDEDPLASDRPTAVLTVGGEQKGYLVSYRQIEDATILINSSTKQYSVELTWDIDLGDQDRPDEIEVVLQKQEGKFSWKAVQVITLDPANGWSGEFDPVPLGYVNDTDTFVFYEYRVRELKPKSQEEQEQEYETEEERLEAADKRVIHDTYDFDKPFISNLIKAADPENLWTIDFTTKWLMGQAMKVTIPAPTFTAKIEQYTDTFGKEIEEHETKYHVKYAHNSTTHHMSITDTAVLDIDVRKIWLGYDDDDEDMPKSVYLMLMSKVDDEYAEQVGVGDVNIYTPVATVVYGSQLNLLTVPGVEDEVKSGMQTLLGGEFATTAAMTVLQQVVAKYTNTGLAIAEAKGDSNNPLTKWRVTFGVKKYGAFGVPMEFAGVEMITGLMEMAIDAIIKAFHIPNISCPVMYHPIYKCWSIKGYAIPFLHDYAYTCNVFNIKIDFDSGDVPTQISGTKTWEGDLEDDRPTEITIHVYAKGEDGSRTEITGSPVTCTKEGNWNWSLQIPLNDIAVVKEDGENSSVSYKEIEIEEEVPDGYKASYDGYNITNTYTGTKTVSGHKSWEDEGDPDGKRPESITIRLLADGEEVDSRAVTEDDDWKWTFSNLPLAKDGREIEYTIEEDPVEDYETEIEGFNVTNSRTPDGGDDEDEEKIRISGYKVWDDEVDEDAEDYDAGTRPESITIRLYADGEEVASKTVTAASGWTWIFTDLPKFRDDGETEIVYSITEDPAAGYTAEIDGFNVTNTLIPVEKVEVAGSKTWEDDDDAAGERPESITVRLMADGEEVASKTVTAAEGWAWRFENLPKFRDDGETEIDYSIKEDRVEGYESAVDGFNVTNTRIPEEERIEVAGAKTWDDLNDADGLRPESITVRLMADGEEIDSRTVTAAEGWAWRFEALPKNNDSGEEIVYSITEDPVEGYITEIHGYDVTNIIVSRVYGYNVNLKGRIGLNVYLFIPQRVLQDGGLYVTLDGKSIPVASATTKVVDGLTLYKFSVDKAAKEMNDLVTVRLYGSDGLETLLWRDVDVTETGWSYCIQTYIDRVREDSTDPLLLAVVNAMSDYGSLAQVYFEHNLENRATVVGRIDAVTLADLEPYQAKITQGEQTGVNYAGSRLVLKSGTVIRHYFTVDEGSVNDYTFKIGSKVVTPTLTDDGWMIEIPDVYARYLSNMYTVTISNSEGRVLTLKYSALSYAYTVVEKNGDADLIALVKAMYLYNRTAEAYFSSVEG